MNVHARARTHTHITTCARALPLTHSPHTVARRFWDGWQPIHVAAMKGHTAIITKLVNSSAEVDKKDEYGETPCQIAERRGEAYVLSRCLANIRYPTLVPGHAFRLSVFRPTWSTSCPTLKQESGLSLPRVSLSLPPFVKSGCCQSSSSDTGQSLACLSLNSGVASCHLNCIKDGLISDMAVRT